MHTYNVTFVPSDRDTKLVLVIVAETHDKAIEKAREALYALDVFLDGAHFFSEFAELGSKARFSF